MHRNLIILSFLVSYWTEAQDLSAFQTPFETFTMATQNCDKIITESGSCIFFEAGGFPEEIDSVTITYREFFTPADMIVHDIAMHTHAGGDPYQLASTGMFEVYALSGEDTISFDPSKRMAVYLASTSTQLRSHVAPYQYDQSARAWKRSSGRVGQRSIAEDDDLWGSSSVAFESGEGVFFDSFEGDPDWEEAQQRQVEAFQMMNISSFGMHNYDYIIDGVELRYLKPSFVTNTGASVTSQIYVVYREFNSVYYFPSYTWEAQFSLLVGKAFTLFSIDKEGNIWKFSEPDFSMATLSHGAPVTFMLEKMGIPDSKASLTQLAGL